MAPFLAALRESPWRRVALAVAAITLVALGLRLYALGSRVVYYDEAWFGYWTLQYVETGVWTYRPILHGPFYARVNAVVFPLLGVSDFTARLAVAVIGGLLPLAAWLFRERLRPVELVALAAILAGNPILLYYSRFMRKDLPLAAFMLVTLGLGVRTLDTRRPRYLYAAGITLGLAATTKESVLLWLLAWLGAAGLLLDRRLLKTRGSAPTARLRSLVGRAWKGTHAWAPHLVGAAVVCLAVVVVAYAPRSPGLARPGLWKALGGEYGTFPAVVGMATVDVLRDAIAHWVGGSKQDHPYLPYLADTVRTLGTGALAVSLLAVLGFLVDRYGGDTPRDLVAFNFYVGVAALVGYPLANNFPVPWSTVHAVVPLAVPAAVGVGVVVAWGRGRLPGPDLAAVARRRPESSMTLPVSAGAVRGAVAVGVLGLLAVNAAAVGVQTSYVAPHESPRTDPGSELVYYAQPPGSLRATADAIATAARGSDDDIDVLYVGQPLAAAPGEPEHPTDLETSAWFARMPLPWYTLGAGADVASVGAAADITAPPPVVIAAPDTREAVAERLGQAYAGRVQSLDDLDHRRVVVFTRQ